MKPPEDLVRRVGDMLEDIAHQVAPNRKRYWPPGFKAEAARDLIDLIDSHMQTERNRTIAAVAADYIYPQE